MLKEEGVVRVAFIPDTHLQLRESKNRVGIVNEGINTIRRITDEVVIPNNVDILIHLGDLFDRSEPKLPTQEWAEVMLEFNRLKNSLNGNLFITLGNHEYTYSRHNPTFMITNIVEESIKEMYMRKDTPQKVDNIFIAPAFLDIGNTRIQFNHFQKENKKYRVPKVKGKSVIVTMHDDIVSYESKDKLYHHNIGKGIDPEFTDIFDNVDLAICGHIHTPLTNFRVDNDKKTLVITPGSMVNRTTAETHEYVNIPIIDIKETSFELKEYKFALPVWSQSFKEDVVDENKDRYEFNKVIKKTKTSVELASSFRDLLATVDDVMVERVIEDAKSPLILKEVDRLERFVERERNNEFNIKLK